MTKKISRAYIEITTCCNRSCHFCPSANSETSGDNMPVDLFQEIINQISPFVEQVFLHVLGEPLLHPKLAKLIKICETAKLPVNIATNGDFIHQYPKLNLLNPIVRQINFSAHAHIDIPETIKPILSFIELAQVKRPDLYFNLRFWNGDANNAEILAKIARHFKTEQLSPPKGRRSLKIKERVYLNFDQQFVWPTLNPSVEKSYSGRCYGLVDQLAILCDGRVTICCLDPSGHETLGNIKHASLISLLNSPKAKRIVDGWNKNQAIAQLCQNCSFRKRFD